MLDLRQRIFVTISVVVAVGLALLLLYLFVFKGSEEPTEEETQTEEQQVTVGTESLSDLGALQSEQTTPAPVSAEPLSEEIRVKQVARIFVERFGSYSNQNDNSHIDDVLPMTTSRMAKWVKNQEVEASNDYQGMTTKVIASSVIALTADSAIVIVDVQRFIESGVEGDTEYASGEVELLLVGKEWKVNGLYWD